MTDIIGWIVDHFGYAGVALLTLAETVFPPLPSEIIIPLAGYHAQRGALSLTGVVVAGTAGTMTGNMMWYWLARRFGQAHLRRLVERHGRWFTIGWDDVARGERAFARHGALFVCIGRMLPMLRTVVSLPAGLAMMRPLPYFLWSSLGTLAWTAALAWAGWRLGERYADVERFITPLGIVIVAPLAAWYAWRVIRAK